MIPFCRDNNAKAVKAPRTDDEEGSISSSDVDNPQPQTARSGSASCPSSLGPLAEDAAGRQVHIFVLHCARSLRCANVAQHAGV